MGLLTKFRKKLIEEHKLRKPENIFIVMLQQHIYSYPHSYFIQAAPKHFNFKGR